MKNQEESKKNSEQMNRTSVPEEFVAMVGVETIQIEHVEEKKIQASKKFSKNTKSKNPQIRKPGNIQPAMTQIDDVSIANSSCLKIPKLELKKTLIQPDTVKIPMKENTGKEILWKIISQIKKERKK